MTLLEAREILKKNGYRIIKEGKDKILKWEDFVSFMRSFDPLKEVVATTFYITREDKGMISYRPKLYLSADLDSKDKVNLETKDGFNVHIYKEDVKRICIAPNNYLFIEYKNGISISMLLTRSL